LQFDSAEKNFPAASRNFPGDTAKSRRALISPALFSAIASVEFFCEAVVEEISRVVVKSAERGQPAEAPVPPPPEFLSSSQSCPTGSRRR